VLLISEPRQPSACISPWKKIVVIFLDSLCFVLIFVIFLKYSTPCRDPQSACQSRAHYYFFIFYFYFFKWTSVEVSPILPWKLSLWM